MDSVWCGDALFVNRRLDALTLLAAVAGRTERVLLGPACMGSFALRDPLVFAYEWASLDVLSNGRTRLVACAGGGAGPLWEAETAAMGIEPDDRRKHMVENMHVLRHLWTKDNEPFEGKFVKFSNITLEPKPVQNPCPIWLATNAERLSQRPGRFRRLGVRADPRRQDRRRLDDAFGQPRGLPQILGVHPEGRPRAGRDMSRFDHVLYHHINVNDDSERRSPTPRSSSISITPPTIPRSGWRPG